MNTERRQLTRRNFSYYMRVFDEHTGELVGQLADISTGGFKLESSQRLPLGVVYFLRVDLVGEISLQDHINFFARSCWCLRDPYDPTIYNIGFQLADAAPEDYAIFVRMFNAYGVDKQVRHKSNSEYLWG